MVLVYEAIHAALLPLRLHDLPDIVGVFVEHIGHRNEKKRPKQTEVFRAQLQPLPSATTPDFSRNRSGVMPRNATGTVAIPSVTMKLMVTPSGCRLIDPPSTIPPSRTARPSGKPAFFTSPGA